jgi:hypothetical protein
MLYRFHALRAPVAHTPKAVHRIYQPFNGRELRCKPDQGGIEPPCQPSPRTTGFQGTSRPVCTPLLVTLIRSIYNTTFRLTGSLALSIAYGVEIETKDNKFFRLYKEMAHGFDRASVPGTFLVDVLPFRESSRSTVGYEER